MTSGLVPALRWLALAGLLLSAGSASAEPPAAASVTAEQEARAVALEDEGKRQRRLGRLEEALAQFERAFRIRERPGLIFNMAQTERLYAETLGGAEQLKHRRNALVLYRRYLHVRPDSPHRAEVERVVAALELSVKQAILPAAPVAPVSSVVTVVPEPAAAGTGATATVPAPAEPASRPWYRRWYVWTLIGAAVVGGAVGGAVAATVKGCPAHATCN
jgi:tetratricopeptide (TPR) repeat protein